MVAKLKNLSKFVENENRMAEYFGGKVIDINAITDEDAQKLWNRLDSNLSPENLTCDGELRGAKLRARYNYFKGAMKELKTLGLKFNARSYN
jgi:hypothetical protein